MYAGAVREAVFSVPEVMRRVNADFVPLAAKAPLVNNIVSAGDENEARIYRRLKRCMLAPQGIGVLSSTGDVLAWVQMFDNDRSVIDFLDYARNRFREFSDKPAVTARYLRFPSHKIDEMKEEEKEPIAETHANGKACPAKAHAKSIAPRGFLLGEVFGRALDSKGSPLADTVRQENYVQDHFQMPPETQQRIVEALAGAGKERVRIPEELPKLCATYSHLGHIDVRPLMPPNEGRPERCEFWATQKGPGVFRIEGSTEVVSDIKINGSGRHEVRLEWEGRIETEAGRIRRLLLLGNGREKLRWGLEDPARKGNEVGCLPGGRPMDIDCAVRYGIIGTPGTAESVPTQVGSGPLPSGGMSIQEKAHSLQRKIGELMRRFESLMSQGKVDEASELLDRVLRALSEAGEPRPGEGEDRSGLGPPDSLRQKMQRVQQGVQKWQSQGRDPSAIGRIMQRFEPLMREGKFKEAERLLDEAIRALDAE